MPQQTNRQILERELLHAVQRYRISQHTTVENGAQLAMELLGKYAPVPDSIKNQIIRTAKPKRRFALRLPKFGKVGV